jgi:hypothetical protein
MRNNKYSVNLTVLQEWDLKELGFLHKLFEGALGYREREF